MGEREREKERARERGDWAFLMGEMEKNQSFFPLLFVTSLFF